MILIVGLGNPGKKFQKTRHNIGFRVADEFAKENNFSNLRLSKKFLAEISEGILAKEKVVLAKPQIFMNNSGKSVKKLVSSFPEEKPSASYGAGKLQISSLWVVHDDVDLSLGKIRIVKNRGSAGHKGVESIIKELGTKNFIRFRIGVKPEKTGDRKQKAEEFVLQKFSEKETEILKKVIVKTVQALSMTLKDGIEKAMNVCNR